MEVDEEEQAEEAALKEAIEAAHGEIIDAKAGRKGKKKEALEQRTFYWGEAGQGGCSQKGGCLSAEDRGLEAIYPGQG